MICFSNREYWKKIYYVFIFPPPTLIVITIQTLTVTYFALCYAMQVCKTGSDSADRMVTALHSSEGEGLQFEIQSSGPLQKEFLWSRNF